MYAIIKTTEKLERAYVRDAISPEAYEKACERLIAQFKVLWGSLKAVVSAHGWAVAVQRCMTMHAPARRRNSLRMMTAGQAMLLQCIQDTAFARP